MKRNQNRIGNLFKKKSANFTAATANEVQVVTTCAKPPFVSSIVVEVIRTVLFIIKIFYTKIKHTNISTRLRSIIKHTNYVICPDKIADKKIINSFLFKNKM